MALALLALVLPTMIALVWRARRDGRESLLAGLGLLQTCALVLFVYYVVRVVLVGASAMEACHGGPFPGRWFGHGYLMPGLVFAFLVVPSTLRSFFGESADHRAAFWFSLALCWAFAAMVVVQTHAWGCFG